MADTRPANIIAAIRTLCQGITIVNGYYTDLGDQVHVLKSEFDPEMDLLPAISILYEIETRSSAEDDHNETLTVTVMAIAAAADDVFDQAEKMDRDIKRAIRLDALTPHVFAARPLGSLKEPPTQSQSVLKVAVRYAVDYSDVYGGPD